VRYRGCLDPVGCTELPQDVRDVNSGRSDTDNELRGDLAVGAPPDEESEDLRLPRGQAKVLFTAVPPVG
jgi:hypothetical protein